MVADVYIGLKKPATFPLTIKDKLLVVIGDFYLGPIPDTLPPKEEILGVTLQDI